MIILLSRWNFQLSVSNLFGYYIIFLNSLDQFGYMFLKENTSENHFYENHFLNSLDQFGCMFLKENTSENDFYEIIM